MLWRVTMTSRYGLLHWRQFICYNETELYVTTTLCYEICHDVSMLLTMMQ